MPNYIQYSSSEVVRAVLMNLNLGTLPSTGGAWPIYVDAEPDTPADCITIRDTACTNDGRTMPDGEIQGQYGVQIRVRAVDHRTGWAKTDSIQRGLAEDVLNMMVAISAATFMVNSFCRIGDVLPIGPEAPQSLRRIFTLNAFAAISQL